MLNLRKQSEESVEPLFWTEAGLKNLGKVIRESRTRKGLTLEKASRLITEKTSMRVAPMTLSDIEKGYREPVFNTLSAIASAGFVEADGKRLNILNFIAIASEVDFEELMAIASVGANQGMTHPLYEFINGYLCKNNLTLEQLSRMCHISVEDLEIIMRGEMTRNYTGHIASIASVIPDPRSGITFFSYTDLLEYCGMTQDPNTENWILSHTANNNGR